MILSSGTIAGAIEGSLWDIPAIAFSQAIPNALFPEISAHNGQTDERFSSVIQASAEKAALIAFETVQSPPKKGRFSMLIFLKLCMLRQALKGPSQQKFI